MNSIVSPSYTRCPFIPLSYANKHMAVPEEMVIDYNASIIYVMNEEGTKLKKMNDPTAIFHIDDYNNPHNVTKEHVDLGNVINKKQATETEFLFHKNDYDNPHRVTKEQVGLGNVINKRQATVEEMEDFRTECKGYITQMDNIVKSIEDIINKKYTLTVNTDVADATVKVFYDEKWNEGNVHRVPDGTYKYTATRNGYYKVEIIPDPLDAKVEIEVDGNYAEGAIQYLKNGSYNYRITKEGYTTSLGNINVNNEDVRIEATLDLQLFSIFINTIPSDAIVRYQVDGKWVEQNPINVPNGTYMCEISKEDHETKTVPIEVYNTDTSMTVRL